MTGLEGMRFELGAGGAWWGGLYIERCRDGWVLIDDATVPLRKTYYRNRTLWGVMSAYLKACRE